MTEDLSEPWGNGAAEADAPRARPLLTEILTFPEMLGTLPGAAIAAQAAPNGASRPVLVLPGFVTGDFSTAAIRAFLRALGHRPQGWGLGVNVGFADHIAAGVDQLLQEMAQRYGSTIDIVGWSAGGTIGRLLAQNRRELVGQVISLGSPIKLQTGDTNIGMLQEIASYFFVSMPSRIDVDAVPVPSTAVWTAGDGVVPGRLCCQTPGPVAETVQVRGTHCGLGTNPAVYYLVADRLSQRQGDWRPFRPARHLRWWYPSLEQDLDDGPAAADEPPKEFPDAPAVAV